MVAFMDDHPEAGAVGCRILNPDGTFAPESRRAFPTPAVAFYRISGLSKLFPQSPTFGRYNLTYLPLDEVCEVDALSGSCMMVRKAAVLAGQEAGDARGEGSPKSAPCLQRRRLVRRGLLHVRGGPRLVLPDPAGGLADLLHARHPDRPLQGREHQEGRPALRAPVLRGDAPVRGEARDAPPRGGRPGPARLGRARGRAPARDRGPGGARRAGPPRPRRGRAGDRRAPGLGRPGGDRARLEPRRRVRVRGELLRAGAAGLRRRAGGGRRAGRRVPEVGPVAPVGPGRRRAGGPGRRRARFLRADARLQPGRRRAGAGASRRRSCSRAGWGGGPRGGRRGGRCWSGRAPRPSGSSGSWTTTSAGAPSSATSPRRARTARCPGSDGPASSATWPGSTAPTTSCSRRTA